MARLLAIITDPLEGPEPLEEIRRATAGGDGGVEVRLVVPAVPETRFRDVMGDVDEPAEHAHEVLDASLRSLRREGISASGEVGDSDPVLAAEDALRQAPADEVLIFEHAGKQAPWFENGLFERAQEHLEPPLRIVLIEHGGGGADHVVGVERTGAGTKHPDAGAEIGGAYFPALSRGDLVGIVVAIVGTIATIILAAAVAGESSGPESGWKAVAIGIAIFTTLINMAHVVGLTLFESVRYRGGFAKLFHKLSMIGTPGAVLANLLILLLT
ncbi:MAG: hypothetical protein ABW065_03900 [Solirubrobacterales bacterium]